MQFRRQIHHDNRRRRALIDESNDAPVPSRRRKHRAAGSNAADAGAANQSMNRLYPDYPADEHRTRVTDLIPTRIVSYVLLVVVGVAAIAGLEALYYWMPQVAGLTTDGRVAAFDLDGEGSLAVWCSSGLLILASLFSVVIYSIRKHKADDYNARYRVWLWAAACWLVMSIDETASLHEGFKEMMVYFTGTRLVGDGSLWWVMAYLLVLVPVGIRLFLDMSGSRAARSALILTAVCFTAAVVTQLGWILPESGARGVMVEEGCEMLGDLLLFLSMCLHARYVWLQAQGRIVHKPRKAARSKRKDQREEEDETPSSRRKRRGSTVTTARRSRKRRAQKLAEEEDDYEYAANENRARTTRRNDEDDDDTSSAAAQLRFDKAEQSSGRKKLTKAERKALRRQARAAER